MAVRAATNPAKGRARRERRPGPLRKATTAAAEIPQVLRQGQAHAAAAVVGIGKFT